MFQKIILAEDFDTYNLAVAAAIEELGIPKPEHSYYCDEALLRIRKARQEGNPFELLISDISFTPGISESRLKSGIELIAEARKCDPHLKVIVFSIESRLLPIKQLVQELEVDAFILKGRNNIPEIHKAIRTVFDGGRYLSDEIARMLQDKSLNEIDEFDLKLLRMLADGSSQDDIVLALQRQGISPNSKSSIEKKLNKLKTAFGANTTAQMLLIARDFGLI